MAVEKGGHAGGEREERRARGRASAYREGRVLMAPTREGVGGAGTRARGAEEARTSDGEEREQRLERAACGRAAAERDACRPMGKRRIILRETQMKRCGGCT